MEINNAKSIPVVTNLSIANKNFFKVKVISTTVTLNFDSSAEYSTNFSCRMF